MERREGPLFLGEEAGLSAHTDPTQNDGTTKTFGILQVRSFSFALLVSEFLFS